MRSSDENLLEVYYKGEWGTVCDDKWFENFQNARVACRQLTGGEPDYWAKFSPQSKKAPIWLDEVICKGDELSLNDCAHNDPGDTDCTHSEDVAVFCLTPGKMCFSLCV